MCWRVSSRRQAGGVGWAVELQASTIAAPSYLEWVARSKARGGRMAEPNPAATGLASSTSRRHSAKRRPRIGTVVERTLRRDHRKVTFCSSALSTTLRFLAVACHSWSCHLDRGRCRFRGGFRLGGEPGVSSGPPSYRLRPMCALLRQRITRWIHASAASRPCRRSP
jgi:hypothetical protein